MCGHIYRGVNFTHLYKKGTWSQYWISIHTIKISFHLGNTRPCCCRSNESTKSCSSSCQTYIASGKYSKSLYISAAEALSCQNKNSKTSTEDFTLIRNSCIYYDKKLSTCKINWYDLQTKTFYKDMKNLPSYKTTKYSTNIRHFSNVLTFGLIQPLLLALWKEPQVYLSTDQISLKCAFVNPC